jgi:CBS domain-containing membrane protein
MPTWGPALDRQAGRRGLWDLVAGTVSITLIGLVAIATAQPFVFPSLGPTAFLIFDAPRAPDSCPRNALFGHLVGVACAFASLAAFRLIGEPSAMVAGVTPARAIAAGLSLGLTSGIMTWLRVRHPPACATTLIVGLGILARPDQLLILMLGVTALVALGFVLNHLAGVDYPRWSPVPTSPAAPSPTPASAAPVPNEDPEKLG